MATLATFLAKIKQTVKDSASKFTDAEKDNFTLEAVKRYSRDRPRIQDAILSGDGMSQEFATPAGWEDQFSILRKVEFPLGNFPPTFIDIQDNIMVLQRSNIEKIITHTLKLSAGQQMRLFYITPHTVDGASSTVYPNDEDAVANLASSLLARALASFYGESTNKTLNADVVDRTLQATTFSDLADKLEDQYNEHIVKGETETGALLFWDQDVQFSFHQDLLLHPRKNR